MYCRDELSLCSLECYFCVYFPRCFATREINTKITLSWALKQFVTRVHTLFSKNLYQCMDCVNVQWLFRAKKKYPGVMSFNGLIIKTARKYNLVFEWIYAWKWLSLYSHGEWKQLCFLVVAHGICGLCLLPESFYVFNLLWIIGLYGLCK